MSDEGPTELARRLRAASATGELVDVSDRPETWVPAQLLVDLLIRPLGPGEIRRAVRLAGAGISGPLDLEYATLLCPLSLHRCEVPSAITLVGANAPAVRVTSCALNSLDVTQLRTRGDFSLAGSAATGEVRLLGAHIGGQLTSGARRSAVTPGTR